MPVLAAIWPRLTPWPFSSRAYSILPSEWRSRSSGVYPPKIRPILPRPLIDRHGGGPYSAEELATIAGVTATDARRVLDQMVAEGLATPPNQPPDTPQPD